MPHFQHSCRERGARAGSSRMTLALAVPPCSTSAYAALLVPALNGTLQAWSMVLVLLLRNSFSGFFVVGPQRLFVWRLLRPLCAAVGHLASAAAVCVHARRASGYHAGT